MVVKFNGKTYEVLVTQDEIDNNNYIDKLDMDNRVIQMYTTGTGMINEIQNYDGTAIVAIPSLGHHLLVELRANIDGHKHMVVLTDEQFKEVLDAQKETEFEDLWADCHEYGDFINKYMNPYHVDVTTQDMIALADAFKRGWTKVVVKVKSCWNKL